MEGERWRGMEARDGGGKKLITNLSRPHALRELGDILVGVRSGVCGV